MHEKKKQIRERVHWLRHFLGKRLWEEEVQQIGGLHGFFLRELRILVVVVQSIPRGQIPLRAAAMTVASLLALVPSIVLAFTLVGAFGGIAGIESHLQRFILTNLVAGVQEQASRFLTNYLEGVHSGAYQGISFIFLLGAVLGLLATVEEAFNQIWGIKRGRSLPNRLTTYTTIAVLGPFLTGLSLMMTASVQNAEVFTTVQGFTPLSGILQFLFGLLPLLVTVMGLTVLYMIMPNTRVSFLSASASAIVAGIVWEISKWGYGLYLSSAKMYGSLYGSLTAFPLLILWIQFSWVIVLFGALLTFAREAADGFLQEEGALTASFRDKLRAALRCMIAICDAYLSGAPAPNVSKLATDLHIPIRLVRAATSDLISAGLLHEVIVQTGKDEGGLVPAKDVQSLKVFDVLHGMQTVGTASPPGTPDEAAREADRILAEIDRRLAEESEDLLIVTIIERVEARESGRPSGGGKKGKAPAGPSWAKRSAR